MAPDRWPRPRSDARDGRDPGRGGGYGQGDLADPGRPADRGYDSGPRYRSERAYDREPSHAGQPAYDREPTHAGQPAYDREPGHAGQPAYDREPGYRGQAGYVADPGYPAPPGYDQDPRYAGRGRGPDPRDHRYGSRGLAPDQRIAPGEIEPAMRVAQHRAVEPQRLAIEAPSPGQQSAQAQARSYRAPQDQPPASAPPGRPVAQAGPPRSPGENTRAVHLPVPAPPHEAPLTTPVYRSTTFSFSSSSDYASVLADVTPGFSYSRIDNPTVEAFATAVASLEGINLSYVPGAQAFASGMAAISTVFLAFTRAGSHVVAPTAIYGGTYSFLRNVAGRFGVGVDFVDMTDLGRVRAALRPGSSVVYAEVLANPTVAVTDLAGVSRLAHDAGALLVVDSTLAPPVICRPLEHGADLVLHSATKYFGGHSDVTGGVVTGHPELIRKLRLTRIDTGGSLGPDDAYLLRRGLETLPLRVRRQCATAQVVAAALVRHPAVRCVYYPGLTGHPGHELAKRQFDAGPEGTRFGSIVTVAPFGGKEAGMVFADRLGLATLAASLGGAHTKVSHVASTTHRQMDDAALAAAGIDPGSVRFSVGLEDAEDLIADAVAALDSLGR